MLRRYLLSGLVLLMAASGCSDDRVVESAGGLALAQAPQLEVSARASKSGSGRATKAPAGLVRTLAKVSALVTPPARPVAVTTPKPCDWTSPGANNQDRKDCRATDAAGPHNVLARVERLNPFWEDEADDAAAFGWGRRGLGRDMAPLVVGDDVYVQRKHGPYTPCSTVGPVDPCGSNLWGEQTWGVDAYRWVDGYLQLQWQRTSSWTPAGVDALAQQFEPVFQPVIHGSLIYIPEGNGLVSAVDRSTGQVAFRYGSPAGGLGTPDVYVSSALTVDASGNVYYTALQLQPGNPYNTVDSWLVKGTPTGAQFIASVTAGLATPVPTCIHPFNFSVYLNPPVPAPPLPWPPAAGAVGPLFGCGASRPVINAAPVVSLDGSRVYLVTRTRQSSEWTEIIAVRTNDLTRVWGRFLRDFLRDGCGVLIPFTSPDNPNEETARKCKLGSTPGVTQRNGEMPSGQALDLAVSSPTPTPDGGLLIGTYGDFDNERGHMFRLTSDGTIKWAFNYGWNQTPAIVRKSYNPGTEAQFRVVQGNSHYNRAPFKLEGLDSEFAIVGRWSRAAVGTQSCVRSGNIVECETVGPLDGSDQQNKDCMHNLLNGAVNWACYAVPPGGQPFEFIMRSPLVTGARNVWVFGADGFAELRSGSTGNVIERVFVDSSITQEDVPLSTDSSGRIYTMFRGHLHVIGTRDNRAIN